MKRIYSLIIPDTARSRVLLIRNGQQWAVPELEFERLYFWQVVGQINTAVREQFGLDVTTLRCRRIIYDEERDELRLIYELEFHGSERQFPEGAFWAGPEAVEQLPSPQRAVLEEWVADASQLLVPAERVPWYEPGWRDLMLPWLDESLDRAGLIQTRPVEQVRSWERSALWRSSTNKGTVYFKAVPSMFGHEPSLTALLAEAFPKWLPPVLAINPAQSWLVMADAGSQPLLEHKQVERWEAALYDYAQLQLGLVPRAAELLRLGVPDRRLPWLRSGMERLLADTPTLTAGPAGLTTEEVATLTALLPELRTACDVLEQSNLPTTLEHGDFSAWQVQIDDDQHRFLDWSDSSIAPPFFSMLGILWDLDAELPDVPNAASRLRNAYLAPWSAIAPMEALNAVFDAALRLAPLHHALMYYLDILPFMEQRWELERMLPYYLRMLLKRR